MPPPDLETGDSGIRAVAARDSLEIAFIGPSIEDGRIDLSALSESLYGLSNLVRRTGYLLFDHEADFSARLDQPIERGSLVVPIEVVKHGISAAEDFLLHNEHIQALATLCTILGMGVVAPAVSLLRLFRTRAGRKITSDDLSLLLSQMDMDVRLELLVRIYNDSDIQAAIRGMLRPLRERGIEQFQTRRRGRVIETVSKEELFAADAAEMESIVREEERTLDITKAALLPDLAWRFSDGAESFDAKILDPQLWDQVERGERYGHGDKMHVILNTTAKRDQTGRLRRERTIPRVFSVTHATRIQAEIWTDDPRIS
jgi:hypothetical protein